MRGVAQIQRDHAASGEQLYQMQLQIQAYEKKMIAALGSRYVANLMFRPY